MLISRSVHVAADGIISFFVMSHSIVCLYIYMYVCMYVCIASSLSIHLLMDI